ncbi:MAG: hypothetical protein M0Z69_15385 [Actinomycetota bacterium]|nr:hypothetical protein [Actinomycetota bacterium]
MIRLRSFGAAVASSIEEQCEGSSSTARRRFQLVGPDDGLEQQRPGPGDQLRPNCQ